VVSKMGATLSDSIAKSATEKKSVAVFDFQNIGDDVEKMKIGETMADLLSEALVDMGKVKVIERRNINRIMEEIALGQTGLVNEATAVEAGNIVGAEVIVTGSVSRVCNIFYVTARAVDVKTAEVVAGDSIRLPDELLISVAAQYYDLHRYPMNAVLRSMIFPGWGQLFNNEPGKAYLTMGAEAALLATALTFHIQADNKYDEYHENREGDVDARGDADDYLAMRNVTLGIAAGVWAYAMIDAYLQTRKYNRRLYGETAYRDLEPRPLGLTSFYDPNGTFGLGLTYRF